MTNWPQGSLDVATAEDGARPDASVYPGLDHDVYERRIERLRAAAEESGVDVVLLRDPASLLYFGGVSQLSVIRPNWIVVPTDGPPTMVLPRLETAGVALATWIKDLREWVEWPDPLLSEDWADPLVAVLEERACADRTVGFEASFVSVDTKMTLDAKLPRASLVDAGQLVRGLRRIKEPIEIELMRIGGRVAAARLQGAREALEYGVPEYELALAASEAGTRVAAEALGPTYHAMSPLIPGVQILGAGPLRSAMAHPRASTYQVRPGDLVGVCFCGPSFFTYQLGFDRPLFVDESDLTKSQRHLLDVGLEATQVALDAVAPGRSAAEVHAAAKKVIASAGMLEHRAHRTGRGVGTSEAETPELRESDQIPLEPGMTFTVEPGIYVPGVGGVRFGDTVAVTDTGYENLTPAPYGWRGR